MASGRNGLDNSFIQWDKFLLEVFASLSAKLCAKSAFLNCIVHRVLVIYHLYTTFFRLKLFVLSNLSVPIMI